ncbi:hypothetical protein [Nonomuraea polychroma]|uniref:hypothetical protein n=1 Tax=Nonomuraea polychroma TaxID=46176 RepID=UPI0019D4E3B6|nr:hypothetical protein [Nonomuraea polychroma]
MASVAVTRRHDLPDAQWVRLEPHLPAASGKGRPSMLCRNVGRASPCRTGTHVRYVS